MTEKVCQVKMYNGDKCGRPVHPFDTKCVCHSSEKHGGISAFSDEIEKIFQEKSPYSIYDFTGFIFPESFTSFHQEFDRKAIFHKAIFLGEISFMGRQFYYGADFSYAEFKEDINFTNVRKFEEEGKFSNCIFNKNVNFSFSEFNANMIYDSTKFKGLTQFSRTIFKKNTWFTLVHFIGEIRFYSTRFIGLVDFRSCRIYEEMDCNSTRFENKVDFRFSRIQPGAKLIFNGEEIDWIMFVDLVLFTEVFTYPDSFIVFKQVSLNNLFFTNTNLVNVDFMNVLFKKENHLILKRNKIIDEEYIDSKSIQWGSLKNELNFGYKEVADSYRQLQTNYINNYRYKEAGEFYIGEQEVERQSKIGIRKIFSINFIYKIISFYGENHILPILWLAGTLIFFPFILMIDGVQVSREYSIDLLFKGWFQFIQGYCEVFWQNLKFMSFSRDGLTSFITQPYQIGIIVLELILVITFITLFLLALRRQFKRKSF